MVEEFYTTDEICKIVNLEFNLDVTESVNYQSLRHWRRSGLLSYKEYTQGKLLKFTEEDLKQIKSVVFVHIVLGVKISKINQTMEYLQSFKQLTKYI